MAFKRMTASGQVARGPLLLTQIIVLTARTDDGVTVFDGVNSSSLHDIAELQGEASISTPFTFDPPIYCEEGIYVTLDTNVTECTVFWEYPER